MMCVYVSVCNVCVVLITSMYSSKLNNMMCKISCTIMHTTASSSLSDILGPLADRVLCTSTGNDTEEKLLDVLISYSQRGIK